MFHQLKTKEGLTCWGGWCPSCQISRQPQGRAAARQVSAWVETCLLSSLPPARDSQPGSQWSEHPLFEDQPEQDKEKGKGKGNEEVVELGRLWSRLKILPGDVGWQPDGRRPEGGWDGPHSSLSLLSRSERKMFLIRFTFATPERKLEISWKEIEDV